MPNPSFDEKIKKLKLRQQQEEAIEGLAREKERIYTLAEIKRIKSETVRGFRIRNRETLLLSRIQIREKIQWIQRKILETEGDLRKDYENELQFFVTGKRRALWSRRFVTKVNVGERTELSPFEIELSSILQKIPPRYRQ